MRRTDKIYEANYYALGEYLKAAQELFDSYNDGYKNKTGELGKVPQLIYLATDERVVFMEARKR